ncbi:MAG: hypothetical protein J6Z40_02945 [Oscillospiraceae bacterium]|nr:hypothetical protein [Oscillospiraceae bacterium]
MNMKKNIIAAAALGAVICLTGCGADINISTATQQTAAVTTVTVTDVAVAEETTTIQDTTAVVTELQTTAAEITTASAETAAAAIVTTSAAAKPVITVSESTAKEAFLNPDTQLYFLYDCKLPYYECSDPDAVTKENLDELNEQLRQIMISPIREQEALNSEKVDFAEAEKTVRDNPIGHEQISVSYETKFQGKARTLFICTFWYGGGAHGSNGLSTFLIDDTQMKLIRQLDDISAAPGEFVSFAADYFLEHYADIYNGEDDWNKDYLTKGMNGDAAWYFADDRFYLEFGEYALGRCYAEGRPCLEIPLAECLPHLSDYGKQLLQ